jgi:hypothetical protein
MDPPGGPPIVAKDPPVVAKDEKSQYNKKIFLVMSYSYKGRYTYDGRNYWISGQEAISADAFCDNTNEAIAFMYARLVNRTHEELVKIVNAKYPNRKIILELNAVKIFSKEVDV